MCYNFTCVYVYTGNFNEKTLLAYIMKYNVQYMCFQLLDNYYNYYCNNC